MIPKKISATLSLVVTVAGIATAAIGSSPARNAALADAERRAVGRIGTPKTFTTRDL